MTVKEFRGILDGFDDELNLEFLDQLGKVDEIRFVREDKGKLILAGRSYELRILAFMYQCKVSRTLAIANLFEADWNLILAVSRYKISQESYLLG